MPPSQGIDEEHEHSHHGLHRGELPTQGHNFSTRNGDPWRRGGDKGRVTAQQPGKLGRNLYASNWIKFGGEHGAVDDFQRSSRLNPGARLQVILPPQTV